VPLFDADVLADVDRRYGHLSEWQRPGLWQAARSPRWAARRSWMDEEWDRLTDAQRNRLRGPLLDHDLFPAAASELALVRALRRRGWAAVAAPEMDGLTPDAWTPSADGRPGAVWEVWTRSVPRDATSQRRGWAPLVRAVGRVARPLAVTVEAPDDRDEPLPPEPKQVEKSRAQLRDWLLSPATRAGSALDLPGVRLRVVAEDPAPSTLGARLLIPIVPTGATADMVLDRIRAKTSRYRRLAASHEDALVVVLAGEEHAGLVAKTLEGHNVVSMTFDALAAGTIGATQTRLRQNDNPPEFDPALSAVGWVDALADEPSLTLWPVPGATVPLDG
jgi:hypothetical protein